MASCFSQTRCDSEIDIESGFDLTRLVGTGSISIEYTNNPDILDRVIRSPTPFFHSSIHKSVSSPRRSPFPPMDSSGSWCFTTCIVWQGWTTIGSIKRLRI